MHIGYFILKHDEARSRAAAMCQSAPDGTVVRMDQPTRNLEQNARLWAMLGDVARQVEWPVDGAMQLLTGEDWKHILSAGLVKTARVAQGIEGGFVLLGSRTSQMSVKKMRDLIELVQLFGDSKGVVWAEQEKERGQ